MSENTTRHINESADKITLTTKVKRGTDTRDQDTVKIKIKDDDPVAAVEQLNAVLQEMHTLATFEQVRSSRPMMTNDRPRFCRQNGCQYRRRN